MNPSTTPDLAKTSDELKQIYDELAPQYRFWGLVNDFLFGVRRARRRLMAQASGKILDVACGTGENFAFLPEDSEITAVDLSSGMLALAERKANVANRRIQTHVMDAMRLDFPADHFDTVVTTLSTCTFPDPIAVLHEMKRVCNPDGRLLLLEHGRSQVGWLGRYQDRRAYAHFQGVGCRWHQEPQELVRAAGLHILSAQRTFFGVFHAITAVVTES
jgi:ubiquinone/menaquinone biosynthesis C-methylase UbiE